MDGGESLEFLVFVSSEPDLGLWDFRGVASHLGGVAQQQSGSPKISTVSGLHGLSLKPGGGLGGAFGSHGWDPFLEKHRSTKSPKIFSTKGWHLTR